jgi:hypothetical protein
MNNPMKFFLVTGWLFLAGVFAQAQVQDAGLWMEVNIEKKITPSLSASFTEEVRLYENITEVGQFFSDLGLSYRIWKNLRIGANYRYIREKRLDDTYGTMHRWYAEASYRQKMKPLTFILRLRYFAQYKDSHVSETDEIPRDHVAAKLTIRYNAKYHLEPFVSAEAFFRVNHLVYGPFDQLRVRAGIGYAFNRMHSVDLYYGITKEYNVKHPETDYVIGLGYNLVF